MPYRHIAGGGILSLILNIDPRCRWVVSVMTWLVYNPLPIEEMAGWPRYWSGHFSEQKYPLALAES
jgi:hypothetical protein